MEKGEELVGEYERNVLATMSKVGRLVIIATYCDSQALNIRTVIILRGRRSSSSEEVETTTIAKLRSSEDILGAVRDENEILQTQ